MHTDRCSGRHWMSVQGTVGQTLPQRQTPLDADSPFEAEPPPPRPASEVNPFGGRPLWTEWQTGVKTLPCGR